MKKLLLGLLAVLSINLSHAVELQELDLQRPEWEQETFYLHSIAVLTRLEVEVEVPWIAKLNLKPEIELQWIR